ncbi:MAG: hypothetical protein H8D45_15695 [Bacteroidetes bacterium]|nr:hypothetical protein [Bacteroidota bacterium]MBL7105316.1 hypothetical protein [Bacteroidales bacterium]
MMLRSFYNPLYSLKTIVSVEREFKFQPRIPKFREELKTSKIKCHTSNEAKPARLRLSGGQARMGTKHKFSIFINQ